VIVIKILIGVTNADGTNLLSILIFTSSDVNLCTDLREIPAIDE
ncbi:unnamed protein product, partial [Rotaria sp. Silwood1]